MVQVRHYTVSPATRTGPGFQLFAFLATCIKQFLAELGLEGAETLRKRSSVKLLLTFLIRQAEEVLLY